MEEELDALGFVEGLVEAGWELDLEGVGLEGEGYALVFVLLGAGVGDGDSTRAGVNSIG